jgi:hypothetical protein
MVRGRRYRRHQRRRLIRKRLKQVLNAWGYGFGEHYQRTEWRDGVRVQIGPGYYPWKGQEGALGKLTINPCSCWMCRWPKHERHVQARLDEREIVEWVA